MIENATPSPELRTSIVLPVYNQAHYLPEAIEAVFAQSYPYYELIVVNDGSTDDSAAVLEEYQRWHEFTVIWQENQGLPGALNTGFSRAQGTYLTWTSADNIMLPGMLTVLVDCLDKDPSVGLVYADRNLMDEAGRDLGRFRAPDYDPALLMHFNLVHCCFLYRRECMELVGGYDPEFIYSEDWEYWIRISQHFSMKHVHETLYRYRLHRASMTSDLVRGTAQDLGYREFAVRMRRRAPLRWYVGKLKLWWLRMATRNHPLLVEHEKLKRLANQASCPADCRQD